MADAAAGPQPCKCRGQGPVLTWNTHFFKRELARFDELIRSQRLYTCRGNGAVGLHLEVNTENGWLRVAPRDGGGVPFKHVSRACCFSGGLSVKVARGSGDSGGEWLTLRCDEVEFKMMRPST